MIVDPFDLASLFSLRELLEGLSDTTDPLIRTVTPAPQCDRVAILPGSFNPPTAAHVLLAERALVDGFGCVLFTHATTTVGKRRSGLIPEDRLLALRAATEGRSVVAVTSHGLYADQAEAAARAFPGAEVSFLVGSDKVLQIFDERWYDDRDAALERLFGLASLIVAPRSDQGEAVRDVLRAPENRRFADRVDVLRLHPAVGELSSTRVRGLLAAGADPAGLVPSAVAKVLGAVRAFAPPVVVGCEEVDAYDVRARIVDLLWRSRGRAADDVDLRALVETATSPGAPGAKLRAILRDNVLDAPAQLRAVATA